MNGSVPELRRALLAFFDESARQLPWRGETDPYRILVSEVMLQQTRVETVKRYYGRWLERFPDSATLAAADEESVLKMWEGLGYYRRARNLHATARAVRERPDRTLPTSAAELRGLPGLGEYTAGAVASIAFGEPVPAVDGNVRRVLARLFDEEDPRPAWLRDRAAGLVDPARPGDFNQALMELGAPVCTPRAPSCERCPVAAHCRARKRGTVPERPGKKRRAAPREVDLVVAVCERDGVLLMQKRPAGGLLGGLWAFPARELDVPLPEGVPLEGVETGASSGSGTAAQVIRAHLEGFLSELGVAAIEPPARLPSVPHRFTHIAARYHPVAVRVATGAGGGASRSWFTPDEADALPLPVAQRRILDSWLERPPVGAGAGG